MKITQKRILSLLLSVALIFTALTMTAMADEEPLIQNSGQPLSLSIGVNNVSENSTKLTFSASMDGTAYYTVYRSDEQPPEEAVLLTKEAVTVKDGSATVVIETLAAQTSYTAYALLENAAGNCSMVAAKEFTTEGETSIVSAAGSPIVMLAMGAGATFAAKTSDGHTLTYKVLTEDDALKTGTVQVGDGINSALNEAASGSLTIPETVVQNDMTYTVTAIGEKAFWGYMGLNGELTIPNSVITIGKMAFMSCNKFSGELILPSNLKSIGVGAFSGCGKFTGDLIIPNQVTTIGAMAFNGCFGLDGSLIIPDRVTWIEDNAFENCSSFDSLILGSGETTIGGSAFEGCTGFTGRLVVSGTVKSLSSKAFLGCTI